VVAAIIRKLKQNDDANCVVKAHKVQTV